MRMLLRSRRTNRPPAIGALEPYLAAGSAQARRLGHNYVGTEHVLSVLVRERDGAVARLLDRIGVEAADVERALACWLGQATPAAKIDPHALATLGIDLDAVREQLEQTFGPGALERTHAGCLGICPRLKRALAKALDYADGVAPGDEHVLLGMLSVPDSVAARVLAGLGVSLATVQEALDASA